MEMKHLRATNTHEEKKNDLYVCVQYNKCLFARLNMVICSVPQALITAGVCSVISMTVTMVTVMLSEVRWLMMVVGF